MSHSQAGAVSTCCDADAFCAGVGIGIRINQRTFLIPYGGEHGRTVQWQECRSRGSPKGAHYSHCILVLQIQDNCALIRLVLASEAFPQGVRPPV